MRALDLFCGAGGASMGLHRAGFKVVGVDIKPQPRYPFTFIQGDALNPPVRLEDFDFIWASPPCQAYTQMSVKHRGKGTRADCHPALIDPTRKLLAAAAVPYVIENVMGASGAMLNPIILSGGQFGLGVHRPRFFESSTLIMCSDAAGPPAKSIGVYGRFPDGRLLWKRKSGELRAAGSIEQAGVAMGIDWMDWRSLCEAIPPVYSEFIGRQFLQNHAP